MSDDTAAPGADDPWGFAAGSASRQPRGGADFLGDKVRLNEAKPGEDRLNPESSVSAMAALRQRARPLAVSLAAVFVFGFITEVVAATRFVHFLGPKGIIIIYPLGSLALIGVAFLQMKWIDRIRRDKAFFRVAMGYAVGFLVAIILIAIPSTTVFGTGFVWLLADQLNFLLPLIVWAIVGDLFNTGEARMVYPWVTSWQYGGQLVGLAIPALAPLIFVPLGIPLPALLIVCPIGILCLGIFLPRALKGRPISQGHGKDETVKESLQSAWSFVGGVKAFRAMFVTSILVFVAGMSLEASFLNSANRYLGSEAKFQVLYGATLVVVFIICGTLQRFFTTKILERLNIPGSLAVLPIGAIVASAVMLLGLALHILPILVVAIIGWWVPRWSIDDVARRAALALVPDERRARVSFLVDLVPFAAGLLVAGGITAIAAACGALAVAPLIALPIAALAMVPARKMIAAWPDSLLSHHLKRRKRLSD